MADHEFNAGWEFQRSPGAPWECVDLPHDAMIGERRAPDGGSKSHGGYFDGGIYRYRKSLHADEGFVGKQVSLFFEGAYQNTRVLINDVDVGGESDGYAEFEVRIDPHLKVSGTNKIEVVVDNASVPNSRWYTGSGIYRPVWLRVVDSIHIARDGLFFQTLSLGDVASAALDVCISNPDDTDVELVGRLVSRRGEHLESRMTINGASARLVWDIPGPALWSPAEPNLYDCEVGLYRDGCQIDSQAIRVGLRTINISSGRGLEINGHPVLLRGANIHHDNGILGAATFAQAEWRRVRILKENGFNAIRAAHNPASRSLLAACDELGMLVMDELFDGWFFAKTEHDYAADFPDIWRKNLASMVAKDRNHPSVILYSVGNENTELNSAYGHRIAAELAEASRSLDPTRGVTIGVNMAIAALGWKADPKGDPHKRPKARGTVDMDSTLFNAVINRFLPLMKHISTFSRAGKVSKTVFDHYDIAGYNYATGRYEKDVIDYPDRIIVGTETFTGDVVETWSRVERLPNVIGDFLWAGWEYLGEAGLGTWEYGAGPKRLMKPYPQLVSGSGMIDITGFPDATMYLAQAAWGKLKSPVITVRPPPVADQRIRKAVFRPTDTVSSWSWRGAEGKPAQFEVICCADEVELIIGGKSLGRRPCDKAVGHIARWSAIYEPGEVMAIAYSAGTEVGRSILRTAHEPQLRIEAEPREQAGGRDELRFIKIAIADAAGTVEMCADDEITLTLDGPGKIAGFGSAAPATEESFVDAVHTTYRGRALLIVRREAGAQSLRIKAQSRRHGTASVMIDDWN